MKNYQPIRRKSHSETTETLTLTARQAALMLLTMLFTTLTTQAQSFGGGSGTSTDPYIITTTDDLDQLATDVNGGNLYSYKYFRLDADLVQHNPCVFRRDFLVIHDKDARHEMDTESPFGLANVAPTVVGLLGLKPYDCWEKSMLK